MVRTLKALEGERQARGGAPTAEELALDRRLRAWPVDVGLLARMLLSHLRQFV